MQLRSHAINYADFFESLNAQTPFERYRDFFDDAVVFQDPFQKTETIEALYHIFEDMYTTLHQPCFKVKEVISEGDKAYIQWDFYYQRKANAPVQHFTGVSRVVFNDKGKAISHVDYWDAATHVYEQIPLLGGMIRFIKRRIKA